VVARQSAAIAAAADSSDAVSSYTFSFVDQELMMKIKTHVRGGAAAGSARACS
jgi:hypothetical protein